MELTARAFLFDMDGTLVDSTAVVEATWGRFAARHGLDLAELLAFSHGRQALDTVTRFLPRLPLEERIALADALIEEETRDSDGIVEVPGAVALIARLDALGAPWALVTSAPPALAARRMAAAGVRWPEVAITADLVARGKPAPDGYLLAAERLGVPAPECAAFEDAPAGVASARASGARTVVVGALRSPETDGLDRLEDYRGVSADPSPTGWTLRAPSAASAPPA